MGNYALCVCGFVPAPTMLIYDDRYFILKCYLGNEKEKYLSLGLITIVKN